MADHETHSEYKRDAHRSHMEKTHRIGMAGAGDEAEDKAMVRKAVRQHEEHDHPGKPHTKLKLKDGGHVDGKHAKARMDRPGRKRLATGGRADMDKKGAGKGNHVNVIVAGGQGAPRPVPVPVPVGGPPGAGMGMGPTGPMPPHPPMGGAPGGPPGGMPMGGAPMPPGAMMHAKGGRAYARGGKVDMDAGASGGLGRLEKIKDYGKQVPNGPDHGDTVDLENMSMSDGNKENQRSR